MEDILMLEGQPSVEKPEQERDSPFGECIRNLRTRMGMSQQNLADRLDLNRATINRIEKGTTLPSPKLLDRMGTFAKEAAAEIQEEAERLPQLRAGLLSGADMAQVIQEIEQDAVEGDKDQDADNTLILLALGLGALYLWAKNNNKS